MAHEIKNADALAAVFGRWPSFHDAEVERLLVTQTATGAALEASLLVWKMIPEVDPDGCYVHKNTCVVTTTFVGFLL